MATTKPFVAAACFCENLLVEKDAVMSAIRIVDTYILLPLPPEVTIPADVMRGVILLKGLISLKSDSPLQGKVHLVMHRVNGEKATISPPEGWPAELKGDHSGLNIQIQMPLGVRNFGLVWFDVLWNEEVLTRMPLMLQQGAAAVESTAESSQGVDTRA
jgi:hypothetical protein